MAVAGGASGEGRWFVPQRFDRRWHDEGNHDAAIRRVYTHTSIYQASLGWDLRRRVCGEVKRSILGGRMIIDPDAKAHTAVWKAVHGSGFLARPCSPTCIPVPPTLPLSCYCPPAGPASSQVVSHCGGPLLATILYYGSHILSQLDISATRTLSLRQ